jgi:hypothetical protein
MLPTIDLDETRGILGSLKKPDINSIEFHQQLGKSTITMDIFGNHSGNFFLGEASIIALYSNIFEKLDKSEMKN